MTNQNTPDNFQSAADGFVPSPTEQQEPATIQVPDDKPVSELTYQERLEKLEISEETATQVIDDMCDNGSYIKKVVVRKERNGKKEINAALITRDTRSQGFITAHVSSNHKDNPVVYNKLLGELQLAASLIHYKDKTYPLLSDIENQEDFEKALFERVNDLSKLPAPVTVKLSRELSEFDLTVAAVMSPGYEDFF